jgi:hypothetical protein
MPFDATDFRSVAAPDPARTPERLQARRDLTLGVFNTDGAWKLYSPYEPVRAYASRALAMAAAQARAADAVSLGRRVELFVQEEDGTLRQASLESR